MIVPIHWVMTDAASISAFKQAETQQQAAFAVARKSLDQARAQGDAAVALLQVAVDLQENAKQTRGAQPLSPGQTINFLA